MDEIINKAKDILDEYAEDTPASLTGEHHEGDTLLEHIERAVAVMKHLCKEFDITGERRQVLIAATYLHDLGRFITEVEADVDKPTWKRYKKTEYSRSGILKKLHPIIGAKMLNNHNIKHKKKIQRLIKVHMSHWYSGWCPEPKSIDGHLICIADYLSSRDESIFEYNDE